MVAHALVEFGQYLAIARFSQPMRKAPFAPYPLTTMHSLLRPVFACLAFAVATSASAHVTVSTPWARATVAQQQATGVFMDLKSAHNNAKLVSVKTDAAASAEMHEMSMQDNVMKMRAVPSIDLPNGQVVNLKPGAFHIMLMGLKKPLSAGDNVQLTLEIVHEDGAKESLAVTAPVRALGAQTPAAHGEHGTSGAPHSSHQH